MPVTVDGTEKLFSLGRYAEIVRRTDESPDLLRTTSAEHRALVAHALFHVGEYGRASSLAEQEARAAGNPKARAHAELVLGLLQRRNGDVHSALQHFRTSLQLARSIGDHEQVAWAVLHEFRALAETRPSESLRSDLRNARAAVQAAGDPYLTVYLHDSIALMEASSGRLSEARRHLQICRSLIRTHPNAWLDQVVNINEFFVAFLECRYEQSLLHLKNAAQVFPLTGERLRAVIECNRGHALLVLGRFEAAAEAFRGVKELKSGASYFAAMDGLARAYLALNNVPGCASAMDEYLAASTAHEGVDSAFAGRWTSLVKNRLLLRQRRFREALESINVDRAKPATAEDRLLSALLECLWIEALSGVGEVQLASRALVRACERTHSLTVDHLAAHYRAAGLTLHRAGSSLGRQVLSQANEMWRSIGNIAASAEMQQLSEAASNDCVSGELDRSAAAICSLASLFGVSERRQLLGAQLRSAIELLECADDVQLSDRDKGAPQESDSVSIGLEPGDGAQQWLRARIPDDPRRALLLSQVLHIGRAAVALETYRQEERNRAALWPAEPVEVEAGAVFASEEMRELLAMTRRVAAANIPVLITGETGTGKEVLARLVHAYSSRAKGTFMPFNCTATPKEMLDSQLFGHRRGAFTGATDHFPGVIRAAAGGTLFLDEIGETTLDVQPKLLRFLEAAEVHPIGETHPTRVDVRILAATNADLETLVAQGRFREDLYYRLNTVRLHLPPLRERRVEIPLLAAHYLRKYAQENGKGDLRLAEETMEYLVLYRWPGNIRQLANEMRRMAALAERDAVLMPEHLSTTLAASRRTLPPSDRPLDDTEIVVRLDQPMAAGVAHVERAMILHALKKCGGRLEDTALTLGLSRKGLYLKRQRYGLDPAEDPPDPRGAFASGIVEGV